MYSIRVVTDHLNFCKFFITKTFSQREARWWERLSGLDLAIEYCEEKSNPADGPSRRPDYIDEDDKPFHTVSYVTCLFTKCDLAQEVPEKDGQASKESEANVEPDISKSQLNKPDSHRLIVDDDALPDPKSVRPDRLSRI